MFGNTRTRFGLSCALAVAGMTQTATADWNSFWHPHRVAYHRNNAWPQPFTEDSVRQATAPFEVMKHNGWRMYNTVGNELFREGDGALMVAGRNRVVWIASQAPADRRVVYVLRGASPAETDARVASVRETLATVQIAGPPPQIMITEIEPTTTSGAWVTQINRDWMEVLPEPRLPSTSPTGAAGATEN